MLVALEALRARDAGRGRASSSRRRGARVRRRPRRQPLPAARALSRRRRADGQPFRRRVQRVRAGRHRDAGRRRALLALGRGRPAVGRRPSARLSRRDPRARRSVGRDLRGNDDEHRSARSGHGAQRRRGARPRRGPLPDRGLRSRPFSRRVGRGGARTRARVSVPYRSEPTGFRVPRGEPGEIVSFACDLPLLDRWGEPILVGPGSIEHAHAADERVDLADVEAAARIYRDLIRRLSARARRARAATVCKRSAGGRVVR